MAEKFVGKWKLVESDNFDEYMKQVGVSFITRKAASALKRKSFLFNKSKFLNFYDLFSFSLWPLSFS